MHRHRQTLGVFLSSADVVAPDVAVMHVVLARPFVVRNVALVVVLSDLHDMNTR